MGSFFLEVRPLLQNIARAIGFGIIAAVSSAVMTGEENYIYGAFAYSAVVAMGFNVLWYPKMRFAGMAILALGCFLGGSLLPGSGDAPMWFLSIMRSFTLLAAALLGMFCAMVFRLIKINPAK